MKVITFLLTLLIGVSVLAQHSKPEASFSLTENGVCVNSFISAADQSSGDIISWKWYFEGGKPASSENRNPGNITYSEAGNYNVYLTVADKQGNTSIDSAVVSVGFITPALITIDPMQGFAPLGVQISTTAPANECTWYIENSTFTDMSALCHIFDEAGNFNVCLTTRNNFGCVDSACSSVIVWSQMSHDTSFLVVPNVFTPNNDLQNDLFRTASQNILDWDTKIYNRWGQQVYSSNVKDVEWDGSFKGKPCDDGIYIYTIKARGGDEKVYDITGTLTLFR